MKKSGLITVVVLAGLMLVCLLVPVGADKDEDGDYECFYEVAKHHGMRFLKALYCKYGCCGLTHAQRCCTKEEKETKIKEKEHKLSGTMIVLAATFGGITAIIVLAIVIYCCCKKHVEKKQSRYNSYTGRSNGSDLFTVMEMGPSARRAPEPAPPVTGFPYPSETKTIPPPNAPYDNPPTDEAVPSPMSPPPPYSE